MKLKNIALFYINHHFFLKKNTNKESYWFIPATGQMKDRNMIIIENKI